MSNTTATLRDRLVSDDYGYYQLGVLLALAVIARLLIFDLVAVNGDTGLYLYDAKQILWGHIPFYDFPTRSPVFEYLLAAGVYLFGDHPLVAARTLMLIIGIATGAAVYFLGRELGGHYVGLAAAALYLFTPFQLVWGLWVKTEPASGLFVVLAFLVAVRAIRRESITIRSGALIGGLLATAFLIRRSIIVPAGVLVVWVLWYRWRRTEYSARDLVAPMAGAVVGGVAILGAVYLVLANLHPGLAWRIGTHHVLSLFLSSGMGSLGYIELVDYSPATTTDYGRWWWLYEFCQKCGANTAKVFVRTMIVTLPLLAGLAIWLRAFSDRLFSDTWKLAIPTILFVQAGWGMTKIVAPVKLIPPLVFISIIAWVWASDTPTLRQLWRPRLELLFWTGLALTAGYLYRDRILYVTYFQDFMPYLSIIAAVAVVAIIRNRSAIGINRQRLGAAIFAVALVTALAFSYPLVTHQVGEENDSGWMTVGIVDEYGDDIESRTAPGDRVFTANPLYIITTDRRAVADLSRKYYLFQAWWDAPNTKELGQEVAADLEAGGAPYAIVDSEMRTVLNNSEPVNDTFHEHYCPTENELYASTNATLYERC